MSAWCHEEGHEEGPRDNAWFKADYAWPVQRQTVLRVFAAAAAAAHPVSHLVITHSTTNITCQESGFALNL